MLDSAAVYRDTTVFTAVLPSLSFPPPPPTAPTVLDHPGGSRLCCRRQRSPLLLPVTVTASTAAYRALTFVVAIDADRLYCGLCGPRLCCRYRCDRLYCGLQGHRLRCRRRRRPPLPRRTGTRHYGFRLPHPSVCIVIAPLLTLAHKFQCEPRVGFFLPYIASA